MTVLPREKQIEVIAALCDGVGIRTASRLTGVNRGTVASLGPPRRHRLHGIARPHDGRRASRPYRAGRDLGIRRQEAEAR